MRVIFDFVVQFCLAFKKTIKHRYCFITLGVMNRCNKYYKVLFIFVKAQNEKKSELFS